MEEKEKNINVQCAWGFGMDVLITFNDHPFILYENNRLDGGWLHGHVKQGSFELTIDQAETFGRLLLEKAEAARELNRSYEEYSEKEKPIGFTDVLTN